MESSNTKFVVAGRSALRGSTEPGELRAALQDLLAEERLSGVMAAGGQVGAPEVMIHSPLRRSLLTPSATSATWPPSQEIPQTIGRTQSMMRSSASGRTPSGSSCPQSARHASDGSGGRSWFGVVEEGVFPGLEPRKRESSGPPGIVKGSDNRDSTRNSGGKIGSVEPTRPDSNGPLVIVKGCENRDVAHSSKGKLSRGKSSGKDGVSSATLSMRAWKLEKQASSSHLSLRIGGEETDGDRKQSWRSSGLLSGSQQLTTYLPEEQPLERPTGREAAAWREVRRTFQEAQHETASAQVLNAAGLLPSPRLFTRAIQDGLSSGPSSPRSSKIVRKRSSLSSAAPAGGRRSKGGSVEPGGHSTIQVDSGTIVALSTSSQTSAAADGVVDRRTTIDEGGVNGASRTKRGIVEYHPFFVDTSREFLKEVVQSAAPQKWRPQRMEGALLREGEDSKRRTQNSFLYLVPHDSPQPEVVYFLDGANVGRLEKAGVFNEPVGLGLTKTVPVSLFMQRPCEFWRIPTTGFVQALEKYPEDAAILKTRTREKYKELFKNHTLQILARRPPPATVHDLGAQALVDASVLGQVESGAKDAGDSSAWAIACPRHATIGQESHRLMSLEEWRSDRKRWGLPPFEPQHGGFDWRRRVFNSNGFFGTEETADAYLEKMDSESDEEDPEYSDEDDGKPSSATEERTCAGRLYMLRRLLDGLELEFAGSDQVIVEYGKKHDSALFLLSGSAAVIPDGADLEAVAQTEEVDLLDAPRDSSTSAAAMDDGIGRRTPPELRRVVGFGGTPGVLVAPGWFCVPELLGVTARSTASLVALEDGCIFWRLSRKAWEDFLKCCPDELYAFERVIRHQLEHCPVRLSPLYRVRTFAGAEVEFLMELEKSLERRVWGSRRTFIREGDDANSMLLLNRGRAMLLHEGKVVMRASEGDCLGELSLLGLAKKRTATAMTQTVCDVSELTRDKLNVILESYPNEANRIGRMMESPKEMEELFASHGRKTDDHTVPIED